MNKSKRLKKREKSSSEMVTGTKKTKRNSELSSMNLKLKNK